MINSLTVSTSNYHIAYQTPVSRYDKPRKLAFHYWNDIQYQSVHSLKETKGKLLENRTGLKTDVEDFLSISALYIL